jgi:penicillin-binding protein-related factor A (putative recombinase)
MSRAEAKAGASLERSLEDLHAIYARGPHRVLVLRCPPPFTTTRRVGADRTVEGHFTAGGTPDFIGIIDGQGIAFDAKVCSQPRFPLRRIRAKQAAILSAWQAKGGIAFIYLRHMGRDYALNWRVLGVAYDLWVEGSGPASLTEDDIANMGPKVTKGWLPIIPTWRTP